MIPSSFIQELLSRTDVVEIVGRQVELKKAGINYKGLCPFHGEKSPSFIVSPSRQTYHCFGCGVHGDAIRFLVEHHGSSFVESVHDLAQQVGLKVPEDERSLEEKAAETALRERLGTLTEVLETAAQHYRKQLKSTPQAIQYLKNRGLTGEVASRFGLGFAPPGWRSLASAFPRYDDPLLEESGMVIVQGEPGGEQKRYDRFRDRIMFPIRNVKGETIAFGGRVLDQGEPKYLNSPETPVFSKGKELYGLYEARTGIRQRSYVLVTEGYMDVVALAQLGFSNAVATLGTACTQEHVHKLLRFTEQIVFSFDGDAAGRRAAGRALEASLEHATDTRSFRFLFLPPEHDPDSFIRQFGSAAFESKVLGAVPLSTQLLEHASEACDLTSAEGRAKMLAQAQPLWARLPEGSFRLQVLADLAGKGGLPVAQLGTLWAQEMERQQSRQRSARGARDPDGTAQVVGANGADPRGPRLAPVARAGLQRGRRPAPKRLEDHVLQMLFGQPHWWESLPSSEQDFLHRLPPPHGELIAWLERELSAHGVRPWAVLSAALADDATLDASARELANADAEPDPSEADFRSALDGLLERDLAARMQTLLTRVGQDPTALDQYRELDKLWRDVKNRLTRARAKDGVNPT